MSIRARVNPRTLDQRVAFERLRDPPLRSATGDVLVTWDPLVTCWARVDGAKATGEPRVGEQTLSVRDYVVWVRADVFVSAALRVADRARWNGRILDVVDIPDQGMRGRLIAVIGRDGASQG